MRRGWFDDAEGSGTSTAQGSKAQHSTAQRSTGYLMDRDGATATVGTFCTLSLGPCTCTAAGPLASIKVGRTAVGAGASDVVHDMTSPVQVHDDDVDDPGTARHRPRRLKARQLHTGGCREGGERQCSTAWALGHEEPNSNSLVGRGTNGGQARETRWTRVARGQGKQQHGRLGSTLRATASRASTPSSSLTPGARCRRSQGLITRDLNAGPDRPGVLVSEPWSSPPP